MLPGAPKLLRHLGVKFPQPDRKTASIQMAGQGHAPAARPDNGYRPILTGENRHGRSSEKKAALKLNKEARNFTTHSGRSRYVQGGQDLPSHTHVLPTCTDELPFLGD